jgi:hypothetical protein
MPPARPDLPASDAIQETGPPDQPFQLRLPCGFVAHSLSRDGVRQNASRHMDSAHRNGFDAAAGAQPCAGLRSQPSAAEKRRREQWQQADPDPGVRSLRVFALWM